MLVFNVAAVFGKVGGLLGRWFCLTELPLLEVAGTTEGRFGGSGGFGLVGDCCCAFARMVEVVAFVFLLRSGEEKDLL